MVNRLRASRPREGGSIPSTVKKCSLFSIASTTYKRQHPTSLATQRPYFTIFLEEGVGVRYVQSGNLD